MSSVLKMFPIAFLSNFGWGTLSIFPLVALLMVPEDFIMKWGSTK